MTRRHNVRTTVAAAVAIAALSGALTATGAAGGQAVVLGDTSSDANGVNDSGEGIAQGVSAPHSIAEADLRTVDVSRLRNGAGRTVGYRLTITTTGRPDEIRATDTPLRYDVILALTSDCRIGVRHVAHRGAHLASSCDDEVLSTTTRLSSRIRGNRLIIKVPYRRGPDEMRPGQVVERTEAYVYAAPVARQTSLPVLSTPIDTASTYTRWTLPR